MDKQRLREYWQKNRQWQLEQAAIARQNQDHKSYQVHMYEVRVSDKRLQELEEGRD